MFFLATTKRCWTLILLGACACTVTSPGPSAVSRAELYQAGEPTYDQFFAELHAQQTDLGTAAERERALRAELANRAKSKDLSPEALTGKVRDRAAVLASGGTRLRLVVDADEEDEDSTARLEVTGPLPEPDRSLFEAVERTARGELGLVVEMTRRQHELDRLAALAEGLSRSTEHVFGHVSLSRMREVAKNLEDGRTLVALMKARSEATRMAARRMLKKLVRGTGTLEPRAGVLGPSATPIEQPASKSSKTAEPQPKPAGPPPRSGPPKPAAAPADFEP